MMIGERKQAMRLVGATLGFGFMLSVTGCDYWPPALQAQVEQLRSETQTLAMEKAQLQVQVDELSKTKQELLAQVDTMSRVNREKTEMMTSLQHQIEALRAKGGRAGVPSKVTAKPATKSVAKQPAKKKTAPKR